MAHNSTIVTLMDTQNKHDGTMENTSNRKLAFLFGGIFRTKK